MDFSKAKASAVLLVVFLLLYAVIKWVDRAGDPCMLGDRITMAGHSEVMTCVDGKWEYSK